MLLEVALSVLKSVSFDCAVCGIISLAITIIAMFIKIGSAHYLKCYDDKKAYFWKENEASLELANAALKYSIPLTLIFSFIGLAPTADDLWKVRISLIKLELASPENVKKSVIEISRIAEKLECKYLGCDNKK